MHDTGRYPISDLAELISISRSHGLSGYVTPSGRTRNPGRVAGFWYLLLIAAGPLRLIYIPNELIVHENSAATVDNIAAHEMLFRLGIASDLFAAIVLIFLTLAFYRLFVEIDRSLAVLVVIFGGVMPALIYFVGVVDDFGVLMVVRRADFLSVFDQPQREALAMLFLKLRDSQNIAAEILWGNMALPVGGARLQIAIPAAFSRRLAGHRRRRLHCFKHCRDTMAPVPTHRFDGLPACHFLRGGIDAVAGHQGRQTDANRPIALKKSRRLSLKVTAVAAIRVIAPGHTLATIG